MSEHHGIICSLACSTIQHSVQHELEQKDGKSLMVMYEDGPSS